jgi:hypothetical protein
LDFVAVDMMSSLSSTLETTMRMSGSQTVPAGWARKGLYTENGRSASQLLWDAELVVLSGYTGADPASSEGHQVEQTDARSAPGLGSVRNL